MIGYCSISTNVLFYTFSQSLISETNIIDIKTLLHVNLFQDIALGIDSFNSNLSCIFVVLYTIRIAWSVMLKRFSIFTNLVDNFHKEQRRLLDVVPVSLLDANSYYDNLLFFCEVFCLIELNNLSGYPFMWNMFLYSSCSSSKA